MTEPDFRYRVAADVPIIMITAYGDPETKRQAFENGAEALLGPSRSIRDAAQ